MSMDMDQTIAEASLDNLNDIFVPEAIGLFPLAPGWVIVVFLLLALLFHFAFRAYQLYRRNLYKREALKELEEYIEQCRDEITALLTLAKRVGIAAYGRSTIADLTSESWWDFMEQHSKVKVDKEFRRVLSDLLYDPSFQSDTSHYVAVKGLVTQWIKTHRVADHDRV